MNIVCSDNGLTIRFLENNDSDFHLLHNWLSNKFVYEYYGDSGEKDFLFVKEKYLRKINSENEYPCIIEYDNKAIGYIQFFEVDRAEYDLSVDQYEKLNIKNDDKVFAIDLFIGEDGYRDKGIGTKALKLVIDAIFSKYNADIILIDPKTNNPRAISCYKKCGFKECLVAKQREEKDGALYDNVIMKLEKESITMKKILIATTNKDKYRIVTYLLKKAGLDDYEYKSLDDINYSGPDKKEEGTIADRAENKAKVVKDYLDASSSNNFEFIIGIDDGIFIKGALQENIKDYVRKILYENYLNNGEEFAFYRAYCLITKSNQIIKTETQIPYTYKYKDGAELKANSYPLSQVSVPFGYEVALTDLSNNEEDEYAWKYSKERLLKFIEEIN